ncbi:ribbon-helix-helix domain-containing protein [Jiella sonneratiae]|uniref:Antitoxin-like ribbon-helix-helix domain-containing protein n=1 Tax=Jiella sonneratiae TaxID=2816856 RepID=A0ABS3JA49_9HYPH|nr:ribbon-helix-helix domain-containing protein [Jiella sonneratiae]MBO0906549.1 hypothetical protein [Jiella sonneratiae]
MATKKRVSLEEQLAGRSQPDEGSTDTDKVVTLTPTAKPKPSQEKATVYMPRQALKLIKQMALDQDKRVNDLLQEGVDMMLSKYGQPSLKEQGLQ